MKVPSLLGCALIFFSASSVKVDGCYDVEEGVKCRSTVPLRLSSPFFTHYHRKCTQPQLQNSTEMFTRYFDTIHRAIGSLDTRGGYTLFTMHDKLLPWRYQSSRSFFCSLKAGVQRSFSAFERTEQNPYVSQFLCLQPLIAAAQCPLVSTLAGSSLVSTSMRSDTFDLLTRSPPSCLPCDQQQFSTASFVIDPNATRHVKVSLSIQRYQASSITEQLIGLIELRLKASLVATYGWMHRCALTKALCRTLCDSAGTMRQ